MRILIDFAYLFAAVVVSPMILYRMARQNRYRIGWGNRLGRIRRKNPDKKCIWIHAVSVGEVNATRTIIDELRNKFTDADLATDYTINMSDMSVFAAQWLATGTNSADLNNDGNVDNRDFALLANQWLLNDISFQLIDPNSGQAVSPDAVRGYVGISIKDILLFPQIYSVSAYLDNTPIGTLSFDWDQPGQWIDLESQPFLNGWHTLRFATIDIYGNVVNHKPVNVKFNNSLYLSDVNEYFVTGQDYKISGFHDGPNSVTVTVRNLDSQTIWTNSYSGSYISVSVPAATMNNQLLATMTIASSPGRTIDLTKKFNPADCPANLRMVIIIPNKDVYKLRKAAVNECAKACNLRNVPWVPLYLYDVTAANLTNILNKSSVKYVYWCGHANWLEGDVWRTKTDCWEASTVWGISYWHSKSHAFSYTSQTEQQHTFLPDDPLPDNWDNRGFDLWSLGMWDQWNKKIVFIDGCFSAKRDDMAGAYGVFSLQGQGSLDQIYIGWRIAVTVSDGLIPDRIVGDTTEGIRMFWERMGLHDSVGHALEYTSTHGTDPMHQALWGDTHPLPDIGEENGDDNLFLRGNGVGNRDIIKLEP